MSESLMSKTSTNWVRFLFALVKINYCGIIMCSLGLRTCKFHITVLELLASYNNLCKRTFSLFQHPGNWSQWWWYQPLINMAQINWITSFLQMDPCLQECLSFGWSDESTSRFHVPQHNVTSNVRNPDKLKLVKYNCKICNNKIF